MSNTIDKRIRKFNLELDQMNGIDSASKKNRSLLMTDSIMATDGGHAFNQWLAENFNKNFDAYDTAIDSVYNSTHIGGSMYHHIIDGNHDFFGALSSVRNVQEDDSVLTEILETGEHLFRDLMSVSGINPFFSLDSNTFETLGDILEPIGISRPFLADALTVNAIELLAGGIGGIALLKAIKDRDFKKLSGLSGAFLTSAGISANPVLFPLAGASLIYALHNSENKKEALITSGKGAFVSGSSLYFTSLIGGPWWVACMTAVLSVVMTKKIIEDPKEAFKYAESLVKKMATAFQAAKGKIEKIKKAYV